MRNTWGKQQHERDIEMKVFSGLVVVLAVCAMLGAGALGCNTFRGAGKDIQKGGQAVENAADKAEDGNKHPGPKTITASVEPGGSISPSGVTSATYGSNQTFTINPYSGYRVAEVLVDGKSVGTVNCHTFDNVTVNHTISAKFALNPSR
jgi:predicted small secreted protein